MEGIYIVAISKETMKKKFEGVVKKINSHINVLNSENLYTELYCYEETNNFFYRLLKLIPFNLFISERKYQSVFDNKDFFYIRKMAFDYPFMKLIKEIKKRNPSCKIILEIPTYPYDNEKRKFIYYPLKLKDLYYRKKLDKYVDRIATFSNDREIFNIKTLEISNGIEMKKIDVRKTIGDVNKEINVIAVAMLSYWHGYDRFIEGLGLYYANGGQRNVILHVVGDGDVISQYNEIILKYGLEKNVIFHGKKSGEELDLIYDTCTLALDAMGRHRSGVLYNSSLKGKEYLAKGFPIVSGVVTELDKDKNYRYYLKVPSDETPIEIEEVLEFYDKIYGEFSQNQIISEIRNYGEKRFDMQVSMKPIIEFIKNSEIKY